MKEPESPCLFCAERHLGCHVECVRYNKFVVERKKYREQITRQKVEENIMEEIELKRFRK